jgi:TPR repeat protein
MEYFKRAADQDFIPAQFGYARCLLYGCDVTGNIGDAVERFERLDDLERADD